MVTTKQKQILKIKSCKVVQYTYTGGPNLGDYFYIVFKNDLFVEKYGNRQGNEALNLCRKIANQ